MDTKCTINKEERNWEGIDSVRRQAQSAPTKLTGSEPYRSNDQPAIHHPEPVKHVMNRDGSINKTAFSFSGDQFSVHRGRRGYDVAQ